MILLFGFKVAILGHISLFTLHIISHTINFNLILIFGGGEKIWKSFQKDLTSGWEKQ